MVFDNDDDDDEDDDILSRALLTKKIEIVASKISKFVSWSKKKKIE